MSGDWVTADSYSISIALSWEVISHDPLQTAGDKTTSVTAFDTTASARPVLSMRGVPASHPYRVRAAVKLWGGQITVLPAGEPQGAGADAHFSPGPGGLLQRQEA